GKLIIGSWHLRAFPRCNQGMRIGGRRSPLTPTLFLDQSRSEALKEKACILIADDSMDNCTMMAALLGHVGYAVETARTVADALRLAQDKACDLYVIDSYFTDARGTDLCRQIRALDPRAPVIFYSTSYGEAEAEAALQAGA